MKAKLFSFSFLGVCLAIASGTKTAQASSLTTLATGLNNPVGLSFGPEGNIYVGETGIGGDGNCQPSPSTQFELICAGNTGSITRVSLDGGQERILDGFDSLALEVSKEQGAGPQQLSFDDNGNAYLITGYAGNPGNRDLELNTLAQDIEYPAEQELIAPVVPPEEVLGTSTLGHLYQVDLETGDLTDIVDLSKLELLDNPDGGDYISNPFKLLIEDDTAYVSDGGANVVWEVELDSGETTATPFPRRTVENPIFPPQLPGSDASNEPDLPPGGQPGQNAIPGVPAAQEAPPDGPAPEQIPFELALQSVTTGIDFGPDGALYVGEYSGFPYPEGQARIFRVGEDGVPEVYADGFTQIVDLGFDEDGNLLVLQFAEESQWKYNNGNSIRDLPSSLIQLAPDFTRTTLIDGDEGLLSATDLLVSDDNEIYVTNRGAGAGIGEVVRVDRDRTSSSQSVPEPSSIIGLVAFAAIGISSRLKAQR